jgi:hypothetical protein
MKVQYKVVDNEFNQKHYPDMIGEVLDVPPAYANVEIVKDMPSMEEIFKSQSKWFGYEEVASDSIEDFVIKCLRVGYDKPEIIEGIGEFFRQSKEVAENIFTRAVVKMKNLKAPKSSGKNWYKKASDEQYEKLAEEIYQSSLEKLYWKEAYDKYPNFNNDPFETPAATVYILEHMIEDYKDKFSHLDEYGQKEIKRKLHDKIQAGLT